VTQESGGKKQYGITEQGSAHLAEQRESLAALDTKLQDQAAFAC